RNSALKPRKKLAAGPEYRDSYNSMSVVTLDFRHNLAYTNTVIIPVSRKTHQAQFPLTPFCRSMSVTRLGVSVENVVATIEIPNNHQGIFLPDKKYSAELLPD